jgi:hypothetical protein
VSQRLRALVLILGNAIFSNPLLYPLSDIFSLVIVLPNLAAAARRLHDIDRSAWWLLNWLTIVGAFPIIYWASKEGTPGVNRFGPDPFAELEQTGQRSPTYINRLFAEKPRSASRARQIWSVVSLNDPQRHFATFN